MLKHERQTISIASSGGALGGFLNEPEPGRATIVFAHGSGSSRHSPRNLYVAEQLEEAGFGTLLFDLLTVDEDADYSRRFDIPLLAARLAEACRWLESRDPGATLGLFGASTGAAAALVAAAELGDRVGAVVSRGGRPDLAGGELESVRTPTLLIVGEWDEDVIELNRKAMARMPFGTVTRLEIVPGATHLFEEPGTLEQAATLARNWFEKYLA
jgi:putative phosphoribosyl transferase